jgi:hypothetical protein
MAMPNNWRLIACAATGLLYFGVAIAVILYQPETQAQVVTADATELSAARCDDAKTLVDLLNQAGMKNQICSMTELERQNYFRSLMRGAIY